MSNIKLTIDQNNIANLVFNLEGEKINKLSSPVLLELDKIIETLKDNKAIKVLLISSGKKDMFIAGADISEIRIMKDEQDAYEKVSSGQSILTKIESLPFPTIAIINGACMGGGLELALACDYRIVVTNPKTKLALPEVNLGIIPGFGGTQRLPQLIGLVESLNMILSGKSVDAGKAFKIGLADAIIREEFLETGLNKFISKILIHENEILTARHAVRKKRFVKETLLFGKYLIFYLAKKDLIKKTKGLYPAPFAALEVIRATYQRSYLLLQISSLFYFLARHVRRCTLPRKKIKLVPAKAGMPLKILCKSGPQAAPSCNKKNGFKIEAEEFSKLAVSQICKNLIELFFIGEELKKDSGINNKDIQTKEIKNAGVLGAGIMGGGIAWLFSNSDFSIRMKDINQNGIALGFNQVSKIYQQLKKIRKLDDNQISLKMNRITSTTDFTGFNNVDIVIEAIVENMEIKKKSLSELENHVQKNTIIASNTSSLSITEMARALQNPERFAGMHFFNPVNRMPLVEVIKGEQSSDSTIVTLVKLSKELGKTPIVVKDVAGFLVNRILIPYINEAGFLLEEGAALSNIDKLIEDFGMPMGPFALADTVGIDVGYKVAKILYESYGERMKVCTLLEEISHNKQLLGKKSNLGFFKYDQEGNNLGVNTIINSITKLAAEKDNVTESNLSNQDIIDRSMLIMINEASRCLEENVVKNARYLDMAFVMGVGFPAFRGGLLRYADEFGIRNVVSKLREFSVRCGNRFLPSSLLIEMDHNDQKFYN